MRQLDGSQLRWLKNNLSKTKIKDAKYILIEGEKIVSEALANENITFHQIYATYDCSVLQDKLQLPNDILTIVNEQQLKRISLLKNPKSIAAVIKSDFAIAQHNTISEWTVALDHIQDPGNLGSIIRSCDWFGVNKIVASADSVYHLNAKVIQSAMGSIFRVKIEYVDMKAWLAQQQQPIFLTTTKGTPYHSIKHQQAGILLMGNESQGIDSELLQQYKQQISIPAKHPQIESLNVGVACGILLAHFCQV